jgi:hypothetical protein
MQTSNLSTDLIDSLTQNTVNGSHENRIGTVGISDHCDHDLPDFDRGFVRLLCLAWESLVVKGTLPKSIASSHLACKECKHFNDEDGDIFYCELNNENFPALCEHYEGNVNVKDERNYFIGIDRL